MKVPLSWLREFVDVSVEPRRLADDLTLAGLAVDAVESHGDEVVLDLDITTNRVDCMNVRGVAREVSVLYGLPLREAALGFEEQGEDAGAVLSVEIVAPDLCPRFCARVLDVKLGPSPAWLRDRLELVGVRPINNVVDLTNYVMMEMGQPMHAFDQALLPVGTLRVRWAAAGERLTTLDAVDRELPPRAGVVAGPEAALALAGVMGGASSEVSGATRVVALEAACWTPLAIRRSARSLGMHTEASHRFERGADPEAPPQALARLAHLLERIGAGSVRPGLIDVRPTPPAGRVQTLRVARASALLGVDTPAPEVDRILGGLGFVAADGPQGARCWQIPSWRGDVTREVDLIEEVGRHYGLARAPSTLPAARDVGGLRPAQAAMRRLRTVMVGAGFAECIGHSLVSDAASGDFAPARVRLANPFSEDQDVLRSSLIVPGLLAALERNQRQGRRDVRLFEVGRVFLEGDAAPRERTQLGLLIAGGRRAQHWSERAAEVDFFDAKGALGRALSELGAPAWALVAEAAPTLLHPGQGAVVTVEGLARGYVGALHPELAAARGLKGPVFVAELDVEDLLERRAAPARYRPLDRFPPVTRDLSVLWSAERPAEALFGAARAAGGEWLADLEISDRYTGAPVPADRVSLMLSLRFRHAERTLTGAEVQEAVDAVVAALQGAGAEIRGGE